MLAAPAGLSDDEVDQLTELILDSVETPQWQDAVDRYRWTERVITGDELTGFLDDEESRIRTLYEEMGL